MSLKWRGLCDCDAHTPLHTWHMPAYIGPVNACGSIVRGAPSVPWHGIPQTASHAVRGWSTLTHCLWREGARERVTWGCIMQTVSAGLMCFSPQSLGPPSKKAHPEAGAQGQDQNQVLGIPPWSLTLGWRMARFSLKQEKEKWEVKSGARVRERPSPDWNPAPEMDKCVNNALDYGTVRLRMRLQMGIVWAWFLSRAGAGGISVWLCSLGC